MENRNQFAEKMINIQKQIITDNNGYYYMDIGRETFYACRKHYEAMFSELKANYVISETDFLISDEIKCDWCGNYNSKLNKMIQKEKHKVICITLGINETRVLKYLNSKEEFDSFDNIYEAHKHYISMKYPLQLNQLFGRLLRKNLVEKNEIDNKTYFKINKKGKLILEVIKK